MKKTKNYLAIAENLEKEYTDILTKAHKECVTLLSVNNLRIEFNPEDTDYDVTIHEDNKVCSLRAAYLPVLKADSIILELYCYCNRQTYATNMLNTDLLPTTLLMSLAGKAGKVSDIDSIENYLDRYVYQVEDYCGQKELHIDGYAYCNEDHYELVQACGCIIPIDLIKGKTDEEINTIVENAFENSKQYQGEITEEEIKSYYNPMKNKPLGFNQINENTPCDFYIA